MTVWHVLFAASLAALLWWCLFDWESSVEWDEFDDLECLKEGGTQ